jgi:hypothetical protein
MVVKIWLEAVFRYSVKIIISVLFLARRKSNACNKEGKTGKI